MYRKLQIHNKRSDRNSLSEAHPILGVVFSLLILLFSADGPLAASSATFVSGAQRNSEARVLVPESDYTIIKGRLSNSVGKSDQRTVVVGFLSANNKLFNLESPYNGLAQERVFTDRFGWNHLRLDQEIEGLSVFGKQLVAHFDNEGILRCINGHLAPVNSSFLPQAPVIPQSTAQSMAREMFEADNNNFHGAVTGLVTSSSPNYYYENLELHLVWNITVSTADRWLSSQFLIDAITGEIVLMIDGLAYSDEIGSGLGVLGLPRDHVDVTLAGNTYLLVDNTRQALNNPHGHNGQMNDFASIVTHIAGATLPGGVASDADNVWVQTAQKGAIDAQVYTGLVYDWMLREFGRNSYDDNGSTMRVSVEYSGPNGFNNAFWNGSQVTFGTWGNGWRALSGSPDVVAHEWGHAITQFTSALIRLKESGALNESFSDMMGAAFEWAHDTLDSPDWFFAENGLIFSNGTRSFDNPPAFGGADSYGTSNPNWFDVDNCTPTGANQQCGIYTNAGVSNKWFYLLSDGGVHRGVTVDGIGVVNAAKVIYRANAFYWTPSETFHTAAAGSILAALDLDSTGAWAVSAADAWEAVDIQTSNPALAISADSTFGMAPLPIGFVGSSIENVLSWSWEFGDGDSAAVQSPTHTFTSPGVYDITAAIVTPTRSRQRTEQSYIAVYADTLRVDTATAHPGDQVALNIYGHNFLPLQSLEIPFSWDGGLGMTFASATNMGLRTAFMSTNIISIDPLNRRGFITLSSSPDSSLQAGTGPVLSLKFDIPGGASSGSESVAVEQSGANIPLFSSSFGNYQPVGIGGSVSVNCCNVPGDADNDGSANIADVTFLIARIFSSGPAPVCQDAADANGNNSVNIADVTYLIARIFSGGPAPICGTTGS